MYALPAFLLKNDVRNLEKINGRGKEREEGDGVYKK